MGDLMLEHELLEVCRRWDLLKHPFYQRWALGELTGDELTNYARQYAHVVARLPRWLAAAAETNAADGDVLNEHAVEESTHVALWERFATALGIDEGSLRAAPANPITADFIAECDALAAAGHGAAVVWSLEAQSPAVSAEKLRWLAAFYGIGADSGGEYFALHVQLDRAHEAQLRALICRSPADARGTLSAAEAAITGLWNVLSSVEQAA